MQSFIKSYSFSHTICDHICSLSFLTHVLWCYLRVCEIITLLPVSPTDTELFLLLRLFTCLFCRCFCLFSTFSPSLHVGSFFMHCLSYNNAQMSENNYGVYKSELYHLSHICLYQPKSCCLLNIYILITFFNYKLTVFKQDLRWF